MSKSRDMGHKSNVGNSGLGPSLLSSRLGYIYIYTPEIEIVLEALVRN